MPWTCFVITRTDRARVYLRRFATFRAGDTHTCQAKTYFGECASEVGADGVERGNWPSAGEYVPHDDPRWPTHCETCGRAFTDDDHWQLFYDQLYADDSGTTYTLRTAPAGAMWRCPWLEDTDGFHGPDGQSWAVMLPPGGELAHEWLIDGPATGGGRWTRTGEAPTFTCTPSVWRHAEPEYHGFLQNGVLTDDINGRTY